MTDQLAQHVGQGHIVEFYESEAFLVDSVSSFVGPWVRGGDAAIVVATSAHRGTITDAVNRSGVDVAAATAAGRYLTFDATELLATFMVRGTPDAGRFGETIRPIIQMAASGGRRVRIFGEMVAILWDSGDVVSAIALEAMWNDLRAGYDLGLLCAYPIGLFDDEASAAALRRMCAQHTRNTKEETVTSRQPGRPDNYSAFASAAAHDLRSPLHAVLGFSELMASIYGDRLDDVGREMLSDIITSVHRMEEVIDGLVHRFPPEPPPPRPVVAESHLDARPLPATLLAKRESGSADETPPALRPLNILLVEDSAEHAKLIGALLAQSPTPGYPLRHVGSVAHALSVLTTTEVDCVLLDLTLPDATDLEAVAQIKAAAPHLPVVVITSSSDQTLPFAAIREGAQDYLVKGHIDVEHLSRSIRWAVQRKALETELARHALHDALTGLPNRTLMLDRLRSALARAERSDTLVAAFYLDLNDFKPVNDQLGHDAGDRVLTTVADRLRAAVRPQDTVARIGGDEFVVICEGFNRADQEWERLRTRIEMTIAKPIYIDQHRLQVTTSVGVAVGGSEYDPECMLREADGAMYRAKRSRRGHQ